MGVESTLQSPRWESIGFEGLAERAIAAALAVCGLDVSECEVSVLACDDATIAGLNAEFRGKQGTTNVLSWPEHDLAAEIDGGAPLGPARDHAGDIGLGDIAIAYETCVREAEAAGKRLEDHVTHLLVHGLLHLLGYDHIRDADAARMEALEVKILGTMGLDDPYRDDQGPEGLIRKRADGRH